MADVIVSESPEDAVSVGWPAAPGQSDFVGRGESLAVLQTAAASAGDGQGRLVLVCGEPGIGKTRLAEEFARHAEDQGALVLWGRCFEQPGAPPYWPWVQLLRECADAHSDDQLRVMLKERANIVAALVPEVGERLGVESPSIGDADTPDHRFRLFDVVARFLAGAAENVPLILVLQ